jgi:hypothetical protein
VGLVATCVIEDDEVEKDIVSQSSSDGQFVQGYEASTATRKPDKFIIDSGCAGIDNRRVQLEKCPRYPGYHWRQDRVKVDRAIIGSVRSRIGCPKGKCESSELNGND